MTTVDDSAAPRVTVVGATGAVGGTLLELFEERAPRHRDLRLVASARSAGRQIRAAGRDHRVHDLADFDFADTDVAFFAAGAEVSRKWVPPAVAAGALVIDCTPAFRQDKTVPLVVPQVNGALCGARPPVVATPDAGTVPLVRVVDAVAARWPVHRVVVSSYQPASGAGHLGVEELQEGSRLSLQDPHAVLPTEAFAPALAFNVLPCSDDALDEDGFTERERAMRHECRRVLRRPDLDLTTTCVRVPVAHAHCATVWVECGRPVDRAELVALLRSLSGVTVHDGPAAHAPTPLTLGDPDQVHIGRIRVPGHDPTGFWLWLVADGLRCGVALNAVQVLEELVARRAL
ncbi:aspartate-semialdehyde dehydrogenase [Streptomyces alkaliterrae]|uniref:Aspartate-semialdehyde dehydrogenase n=1 Tax=Streptomyces alkaliterrae TaxID=2213162 RepID=A0A5P0YMX2_9ACTN|nr:aspartate-semialdehyde dehydrogenase [Streptomyces alkaliterrae]MBB1253081.1 aspartate-semialdehyde dehydrogenase [Streptomyces alkaliterrae]MBB1257764.1 aspartate-semialdehyde dehydrogenase [Streptomyces alkaliterrae]MQS01270.1 aspartate-semialdehyde dehydrogenase [Streptomyces alkaliterrae]